MNNLAHGHNLVWPQQASYAASVSDADVYSVRCRLDSAGVLQNVLAQGNKNRKVRETRYNESSSRSHSILQIHVTLRSPKPDGSAVVRYSKLSLVDLAGSERWGNMETVNIAGGARPDSKGEHFGEMSSINQSLTTLGKVVLSLSEGTSQVMWRDVHLDLLQKSKSRL